MMNKFAYLSNANPEYIEDIYAKYLEDPDSIAETWRYFFEGLELGYESDPEVIEEIENTLGQSLHKKAVSSVDLSAEAKVADLINAYRERGHLVAKTNPIFPNQSEHPLLALSHFGLSDADLDKEFTAGKFLGLGSAKLSAILARLQEIYCSSIGVQYTHIPDPLMRGWLVEKMEASGNKEAFDNSQKKRILGRLAESESFEKFLHTRYVAQKRFSIEGAEGLIPTLDRLIDVAGDTGATDIVMGMAHRGRLNVLRNVFGKKAEHILTEYEQDFQYEEEKMGEGDVKYHMGFSADVTTSGGQSIHLSLANNPSHLAFVHPVVEGVARSKQRRRKEDRSKVIPVVIHGDAAFAGQGVVYETLNLSQVDGFTTGGTVHIIINNQIGFTTNPNDARSTLYSTDIAKMMQIPIFHVNGDDPEALSYVARLCMEFRQKFHQDVLIDIVCYRKYGHNESDEPAFTQPLMYKLVRSHKSPHKIYADKLVTEGVVSNDDVKAELKALNDGLIEAQKRTREEKPAPFVSSYASVWGKYRRPSDQDLFAVIDTTFEKKRLINLAQTINTIPDNFGINPKIKRMFDARLEAVLEDKEIDWGNAESLAYATLLAEGHSIRLTGQDVERGTFSHRNAVLFDSNNGETFSPYQALCGGKNDTRRESDIPDGMSRDNFCLIKNSTLSETGVLAFEYGWSLGDPSVLVVWEAQFGDFANGAQVIIDQFIASGESKWQRASGIVMYLPHGYEGQGPEHSSARFERFLQLCGKANMTVANLTTPAQLFHALRRQLKRDFRKPLVLMTPKSGLRHPDFVSTVDELSEGRFKEVIDDANFNDAQAAKVKKVLLCTGKVYVDLLAKQREHKILDVAIIRIEQLYPWPEAQVVNILSRYTGVKEFHWVQEEPRNMGAWLFVHAFFNGGYRELSSQLGNRPLRYCGRGTGAAPAVGSAKLHKSEQDSILNRALGIES